MRETFHNSLCAIGLRAFAVATCLALPRLGRACEPCARTLDFEQTARRADLVIVGRAVAKGPWSDPSGGPGGPEWFDLSVKRTLKGKAASRTIRVAGWKAMCPYGIMPGRGEELIFLAETSPGFYDAVDAGCAQKTYAVRDSRALIDGRWTELSEVAKRLQRWRSK